MDFLYFKKKFMQRCIAKNLTDNTLRGYEEFFRSFEKYLISIRKTKNFEEVTASDLRGYFIEAGKTMKGITQVGYHRRLTTFYNFLVSDALLTDNLMKRVERPKAGKRIIQSFSSTEVHTMLNAYDVDTFIGRRNYTLLCLLLATGLRRSEFLSLNVEDVHLQDDFIQVIGKGDKERIIPITKGLTQIIRKYLKARKDFLKTHAQDTNAFIINRYGKRLKISGSNSIFRKLRIDYKLTGKRFSAHIWRHTFAKAFLLNGGDVFTLQELLGHEDVETTKEYVTLTDTDKALQNARYNPLDNRKWEYY
ncbi:tyrosine-type recombinase/integrase [uncultured Phascolarctobacterium sp.]|uniref:tyrosine-type recombinase/integrase n=1 Tax=uncultured Phascolarctobacterium sp. TaxID=512296 RepID=UPI0025D05D43|nr:tyrosine-type recombinase/integrase [uncultured Phascolarctobacterium sp.]